MDADALAAYQAALLELLDEGLSPEDTARRLATDPVFAPYRAYTTTLEPRMIGIGIALVKTWGRRREKN